MLFLQLTWINLKICVQCLARFCPITPKITPGLLIFLHFCYLGLQTKSIEWVYTVGLYFPVMLSYIAVHVCECVYKRHSFRFSTCAYKSNSTASVVQVDWNLQKQLGGYLQFWPWKCRSRSPSTTFCNCVIRWQISKSMKVVFLALALTVSEILTFENIYLEKVD